MSPADDRPRGFEVPLHHSLVDPLLIAGLPRRVGLVLWTLVGALVLGLREIWTLPVALLIHAAGVAATRADPDLLLILPRALKLPSRLDP